MMFSFEKPTIRLYKYYFLGIEKPIMIQAMDSRQARATLDKIWMQLGAEYQNSRIIGETTSVPVIGVTEREAGGKTLVWVGTKYSPNGWIEKSIFEKNMGK